MSATIQAKIAELTARKEKYELALDKALKAQEFRAGDMSAKLANVDTLQTQIDKLDKRLSRLNGSRPNVMTAKFSNWNS